MSASFLVKDWVNSYPADQLLMVLSKHCRVHSCFSSFHSWLHIWGDSDPVRLGTFSWNKKKKKMKMKFRHDDAWGIKKIRGPLNLLHSKMRRTWTSAAHFNQIQKLILETFLWAGIKGRRESPGALSSGLHYLTAVRTFQKGPVQWTNRTTLSS